MSPTTAIVDLARSASAARGFLEASSVVDVEEPLAGALAGALARAWAKARAAWDFDIDPCVFATYLGRRFSPEAFIEGDLPVADLYLACGCLLEQDKAFEAFTRTFGPDVERIAARLRHRDPDELAQLTRHRLLVHAPGREAGLSAFDGRGSLRSFVRVTALRLGLDQARVESRQHPTETLVQDVLPAPEDPPELAYLKLVYGEQFREALVTAVQSLSARDRNVLRYRHVEGLDAGQIGALYDVHEASVRRWVAQARAHIVAATRQAMLDGFGLPASELDSVMRLLRSELDVSLISLFR
jgi:RNA polymerase sigma-70 factor (ECF subfamily)